MKCQISGSCFDSFNNLLQEDSFLFRKIKENGTKIVKMWNTETELHTNEYKEKIKWIHPASGEGGNMIEVFEKKMIIHDGERENLG